MVEIRRIQTKEEIAKKDNRNKLIIGIVLAALMLFSTAGYAFFSGDKEDNYGSEKVSYNGLEFIRQGDYWQTNVQGNPFYFRYLPNETEDYAVTKVLNDYARKPLYFTGNSLGEQEIILNLNSYVERIQQACLQDTNCTENLPVKDCSSNVIVIKDANFSVIREEDNCVFIFSNNTLREVDGFLYKILDVK